MKTDGSAAFAGRVPAWHRLGYVNPDGKPLTVDEAIDKAGLDFEQTLVPLTVPGVAATDLDDRFRMNVATLADGTTKPLGVVSPDYKSKSPREVFDVLSGVVETGELEVEAACAIRDYRTTCLTVRLPDSFHVDKGGLGDEVRLYGFASAGNDGNAGIRLGLTPFAVVCANTDAAALDWSREAKRHYTIHHRANVDSRLEVIRTALSKGRDYVEEYVRAATVMARTPLSDERWEQLLSDVLVPEPKKGAPEYVKTRSEEKRSLLDAIYRGHAAGSKNARNKGTAYGAFSAYTEFVDFYRDVKDPVNLDLAVVESTYADDKSDWFRKVIDLSVMHHTGQKKRPSLDTIAKTVATVGA